MITKARLIPTPRTTARVRLLVAVATLSLTLAGTTSYVSVATGGRGLNAFELATVPLFTILFAWIAFSFSLATLGFVAALRELRGRDCAEFTADPGVVDDLPQTVDAGERRAAVLLPIYNESPDRVFAGVQAMIEELRERGGSDKFDFYLLSDSTNPETWLAEEVAWSNLAETLHSNESVYYRHRPQNKARKSGNIADFVERWGSHYEYMIVLDADSLVSAGTMQAMVERMDADEQLGILQVPPVPIGRSSLFARIQQFAASVYGPIFVKGFALWAGDEGNYWGHNAIIRVEAFRRHCDLPVLPGLPPLGGEILSHDFVEAALLVQSGWKVHIATDLGGSYEECPTTLADYAQRDQRWCQGNMQHSRLLFREKFRLLSRFHFGCGVMSYAASPLWMLFTMLCVAGTIAEARASSTINQTLSIPGAVIIFAVAMTLLLLPKLWSVLLVVERGRAVVASYGGVFRLAVSALLEVIMSVLLSPIMAIFHCRFVIAVLRGKTIRWSAQQRDERGVAWREAVSQFGVLTVAGWLVAIVMWLTVPALLPWFSPLLFGVVCSIPIAVAMGSRPLGQKLRGWGLFLVPSETKPPAVCRYHRVALLETDRRTTDTPPRELFEAVISDPRTFALHARVLRSTDADLALPAHHSKAIEAAFASGGVDAIPAELRTALLSDGKTLTQLHVEAQVTRASTAT